MATNNSNWRMTFLSWTGVLDGRRAYPRVRHAKRDLRRIEDCADEKGVLRDEVQTAVASRGLAQVRLRRPSDLGRKQTFQLEQKRLAPTEGSTTEFQVVRLTGLLNLECDLTNPTRADKIARGMKVLIWIGSDHLQQVDETIDIRG